VIFVADIIYPAFMDPHLSKLFMPVTGVAAFVAELIVYTACYWRIGFGRLLVYVLGANIVSSLTGVGLALALPSGLVRQPNGFWQPGPQWSAFATVAWPTACLASILIEYPVLWLFTRQLKPRWLFGAVCIANMVSYVVLHVANRIEVQRMWSH